MDLNECFFFIWVVKKCCFSPQRGYSVPQRTISEAFLLLADTNFFHLTLEPQTNPNYVRTPGLAFGGKVISSLLLIYFHRVVTCRLAVFQRCCALSRGQVIVRMPIPWSRKIYQATSDVIVILFRVLFHLNPIRCKYWAWCATLPIECWGGMETCRAPIMYATETHFYKDCFPFLFIIRSLWNSHCLFGGSFTSWHGEAWNLRRLRRMNRVSCSIIPVHLQIRNFPRWHCIDILDFWSNAVNKHCIEKYLHWENSFLVVLSTTCIVNKCWL